MNGNPEPELDSLVELELRRTLRISPFAQGLIILRGKLIGDASVYIGATIINAAIPFLLLPFLTRWLNPQQFGIVALFLAQVNILQVIVGLGAHGLVGVVYYRDGAKAMPPQVGVALGIIGVGAAVSLVAIGLFGGALEPLTGISRSWLWAVVLASSGQCVIAVAFSVFQTLRQPYRFAAVQLGFGLILAVSSIVLIGLFGYEWEGRALGQALAAGVVATTVLVVLTATGSIDWNMTAWPIRKALQFSLPLLPHMLGGVAMTSVDRFALARAVDASAVGVYFIAMQISSILLVLGTALSQAWSPWLYEQLASDTPKARRQIVQATYGIFALLLFGGASLAILAPFMIPVVAGPGYGSAIAILEVLGPAYAFNGMYHFVTPILFYETRTATLSAITLTTAAFQTALSFALAFRYGVIGVAFATLLAFVLYFSLTWFFAARAHPLPWRHPFRLDKSR